ncbi:MAG: peptide-methionine (R)-S-oxide reductase MsrB [Cellulophaga sp.]
MNTIVNKMLVVLFIMMTSCKGVSQEKEAATEEVSSKTSTYKVTKTDSEWRKQLTDIQFYILRKSGTENPFTSSFLTNKEKGTYACAGCGTHLFKSSHKFKSGTGWPSFDREIKGNVLFDVDYKIGYRRTEEHCAVCGGHLGHVFDDGPSDTTGERHCINGAALTFIPEKK